MSEFTHAGPVIYVGPRPPSQRRLHNLAQLLLGVALGASMVGVANRGAVTSWVGRTVAKMETHAAHTRIPGAFSNSVAFTSLLNAEDAWAMGNATAAAQQWLLHIQQPDSSQDLQVAGWALRAAVKSDDSVLIARTVTQWNRVRAILPSDVQSNAPRLHGTAGRSLYEQLVSAGHGEAQTYDQWMARRPVAAEIIATLNFCHLEAGCKADLPIAMPVLQKQVNDQITSWKNRGFTAQEAWDLYRERQMMGDSEHEVSSRHHQTLSPIEQVRLTMQQRLSKVRTPQDLPSYWAAWKTETDHLDASQFWVGGTATIGGLWGQQVDWVKRLSGHGTGWSSFSTQDVVSQWDRLHNMLTTQLETMPTGPIPLHLTEEEADKRLLQSVHQAGLRQLRWPAVFPNTPEVKWRLAGLIEKGNETLQKATGWEGPVLGHAGHIVLALSAASAGMEEGFETTIPTGKIIPDNVIITTVMGGDSLGEIAHEWFHAHDYLLGRSRATSQRMAWASNQAATELDMPMKAVWVMVRPRHASPEQPMNELWENMRSPELTSSQRLEGALEGWTARWTARQPEDRVQWLAEAAAVRQHRWTPTFEKALWGDAPLRTDAQSELNRLVAQSSESPSFHQEQDSLSASGWMRASMAAAAPLTDMARPSSNDSAVYWSEPTEMLARSFERQLSEAGIVTGRQEAAWIYYPQGAEKAWQEPVWAQYFKAQKAWWDRQRTSTMKPSAGTHLGAAVKRPHTGSAPSPR